MQAQSCLRMTDLMEAETDDDAYSKAASLNRSCHSAFASHDLSMSTAVMCHWQDQQLYQVLMRDGPHSGVKAV